MTAPTVSGEGPKIYKGNNGDTEYVESGGEHRYNAGAKQTAAGVQAALVALTDGSTGTANALTGIASISDSATKNAVATLAAAVNAIIVALQGVGISS